MLIYINLSNIESTLATSSYLSSLGTVSLVKTSSKTMEYITKFHATLHVPYNKNDIKLICLHYIIVILVYLLTVYCFHTRRIHVYQLPFFDGEGNWAISAVVSSYS